EGPPPGEPPPGFQPPSGGQPQNFQPPPGMSLPAGPPPGLRQGGLSGHFRHPEFDMSKAATPPEAPKDQKRARSEQLTGLLALRLGVNRERVRLFVSEEPLNRGRFDDDPQLREGFTAAWQRDSGEWRILRSEAEGFPNAFQRQAMWLFAIGALLLLP